MYQFLKDFQTLAAALVALVAAVVAFISAQRLARTQAQASRAAVSEKHELDERARKEREAREQRAFAVLLDQFADTFVHRLKSNCDALKDLSRLKMNRSPLADESKAQAELIEIAIGRLFRHDMRHDELSFLYVEIAAFEFHLQRCYYDTRRWVARSDGLLETLMREVEQGDLTKQSAQEKIVALESGKSALKRIRSELTQYL